MKIGEIGVIIYVILFIALGAFLLFWVVPHYTVPIITYHSIGYQNDALSVSPENLDRQLAYLKTNHYNVISLDALVEGIKSNKKFEKTVVITFDDGRKDNYQYAYPILKKYHFPVTIFLAANLINTNPGFMTWDDVRTMMKDNISFEAHTKNHVFLSKIKSDETLWDEIAGAKKMIEDNIGTPVYYFSYPYGAFNEKVQLFMKKAGFKAACTTNVGPERFNKDLYALKRIRIKNDSSFTFWAKLSGYYNLFRRPRLEMVP